MEGGSVCQKHGGKSGHVKAVAERRIAFAEAEGKVAALLRECDLPEQHPIDGLLEVVRHSGAMMRMTGFLVAQLDDTPDITYYTDSENVRHYLSKNEALYGPNHMGDSVQHPLVIMYGQWADRYAKACKLALDANIDERLVRNAEATSGLMFEAFRKAVDAAQLTPAQGKALAQTLAVELRKLADPLTARELTA